MVSVKFFVLTRKSRHLLRYWEKYPRALGNFTPQLGRNFLSHFYGAKIQHSECGSRIKSKKFSIFIDFFLSPFRVTVLQLKMMLFRP